MQRSRTLGLYLILGLAMTMLVGTSAEKSFAGKITTRIKGGNESVTGSWQGVVALVDAGQNAYLGQFGSGALIDPYWVVTSARNVMLNGTSIPKLPDDIEVISGEYNLFFFSAQRIKVKRIVVHPDFSSETKNADIALLELESPSQQPVIARNYSGSDLAGKMATVLGWGLADLDNFPSSLQETDVPIVSDEIAKAVYTDKIITDTMIFAGYSDNSNGPCLYDEGAPLILNAGNTQLLTGIFSWNTGCDQPGYYGAYTDISSVNDFIDMYVPLSDKAKIIPLILSSGDLDTVIEVTNTGLATSLFSLIPKNSSGKTVSEAQQFSIEPGTTTRLFVGNSFLQSDKISYMVMENSDSTLDTQVYYSFNQTNTSAYPAILPVKNGDINITGLSVETGWTLICLVNPSLYDRTLEFEFNTGDVATVELAPGEQKFFSIKDILNTEAEGDLLSATIRGADNIAGLQIVSENSGSFEDISLKAISGVVQTN